MIAIKTVNLTQNFKQIAQIVLKGEKVLVSRPKNENLVILTEKEYNEMDKLRQNSTRQQKISAINNFLAAVTVANDDYNELTDTDWDRLATIRSQTNLSRKVAL